MVRVATSTSAWSPHASLPRNASFCLDIYFCLRTTACSPNRHPRWWKTNACQNYPLQPWVETNQLPNLKLWRLDGKVTRSRLWLESLPRLKLWRLDGKVTRSRLLLNFSPKLKLRRLNGNATDSRLWFKSLPKLKLWRLDGKITCSRLWLKFVPRS